MVVSSPHRYCQNQGGAVMRQCPVWFQALIGTAKTSVVLAMRVAPS